MTEIFDGDAAALELVRAGVYGIGSSGKSSLSTRLPGEWGNGIVIAGDKTTARMRSVLPADRRRCKVVVPSGYKRRAGDDPAYTGDTPDEIIDTNWKNEAYHLSQRNWPKWLLENDHASQEFVDGFTPGFLLWDGFSGTGDELLRENARKCYFIDHGPTAGPKHPDLEPGTTWKMPQKGDYNMVQSECLEIIDHLVDQPYHVIVTFQEAIQEADAGKFRDTLFGPCSVGRAGPRTIPNRFDINLYLNRERNDENPEGFIKVQLVQAHNHVAGAKTPNVQAAIANEYKLISPDPDDARELWRWLEALGAAVEASTLVEEGLPQ